MKIHQATRGRTVTTTFQASPGDVCSRCGQVIDAGERVGVTTSGKVSHVSEGVCRARARARDQAQKEAACASCRAETKP